MEGLREFLRAAAKAEKDTKKKIRARFREVGEIVRRDAAARFSSTDAKTAGGYRVSVRQRGVSVEQRLGKTTGKRGDFGALQMRKALIPASQSKLDEIEREMERALDDLAREFG